MTGEVPRLSHRKVQIQKSGTTINCTMLDSTNNICLLGFEGNDIAYNLCIIYFPVTYDWCIYSLDTPEFQNMDKGWLSWPFASKDLEKPSLYCLNLLRGVWLKEDHLENKVANTSGARSLEIELSNWHSCLLDLRNIKFEHHHYCSCQCRSFDIWI